MSDPGDQEPRREKAILVKIFQEDPKQAEESLDELAALTDSAGATVSGRMLQRRQHPDPATYFGAGRLRQLKALVARRGADTVVADAELSPSQRRGLENEIGVKVIDRTAVILDIFSQRATNREGKVVVELARLEYLLPRLRGWDASMSRRAGGEVGGGAAGLGSRGPGEAQIELDSRRIQMRMARLRKLVDNQKTLRETERTSRKQNRVPSVAIVGYTNSGKTSLINALASAGLAVGDTFFVTVEPTVTKGTSVDGTAFTLTDTVGFIRHLPHQLVEAFRSTLEEIAFADVILHVVDAAHPDTADRLATVRTVLGELGAGHTPEVVAFSKADLLADIDHADLHHRAPDGLLVSAETGEGLPALHARLSELLPAPDVEMSLLVPYEHGDVVSRLDVAGRLLSTAYEEGGILVRALVRAEDTAAVQILQ